MGEQYTIETMAGWRGDETSAAGYCVMKMGDSGVFA